MATRFIKVSSFYKPFLQHYYQSYPEIASKSYQEQHRHLMDQGYGYSHYFPFYLEKNHSIQGHELIYNAQALQNAWAKEHGSEHAGNSLLLEQLKTHQPEILFIQNSIDFHESFIRTIKEEVKSVKLLIGHCCTPYTPDNMKAFRQYDLMLSCSETFLSQFSENNIRSYLFPHAIEASLIQKISQPDEPSNEIVFIGSLLYRKEFHSQRISYIEEIFKARLPLTVYGLLERDSWHTLKMKQSAYLLLKMLQSLGFQNIRNRALLQKVAQLKEMPRRSRYSEEILRNIRQGQIFGLEMLKTIARYTIGFNMHAEVAGEYAANVRMFEVSGVGSLLVTDHKKRIESLFEPDREILTYRSKEECTEKLRWAIEHPEEARKIALAGQKRTLRDHSVEKRAEQLYEIIRKEL